MNPSSDSTTRHLVKSQGSGHTSRVFKSLSPWTVVEVLYLEHKKTLRGLDCILERVSSGSYLPLTYLPTYPSELSQFTEENTSLVLCPQVQHFLHLNVSK